MRVYVGRIVGVILALVGFAVLLYPTAASWVNQYTQSTLTVGLHQQVKHTKPSSKEQIEQAHKYNSALVAGARLAPNTNVPLSDVKKAERALGLWDYEKILRISDTSIMGRILIPKADVDLPIYHGTSDDTLLLGAGHLQGTSLPVGGAGTRTVITAHRGLAEATMFTYLDRLEKGDIFTLSVLDDVLAYRVRDVQVVEPEDSTGIKPEAGKDLATLVTCTPLGINTQRILVTGERIYPTPQKEAEEAKAPSGLPHFPWFAVFYAIGFVAGMGVILHSWLMLLIMKREENRPTGVAHAV